MNKKTFTKLIKRIVAIKAKTATIDGVEKTVLPYGFLSQAITKTLKTLDHKVEIRELLTDYTAWLYKNWYFDNEIRTERVNKAVDKYLET